MDTTADNVKKSCTSILKKISKNRRHLIKKEFFDPVPANQVSIKSPVKGLPDSEWQRLVALWSTPRHKVCAISLVLLAVMYLLLFLLIFTSVFLCTCSFISMHHHVPAVLISQPLFQL